MDLRTLELLACPACRNYPLDLEVLDGSSTEVETGYLRCTCGRFYFVLDGIARLLTEEFEQLIETRLLRQKPDEFEPFTSMLRHKGQSDIAAWSLGDVSSWDA